MINNDYDKDAPVPERLYHSQGQRCLPGRRLPGEGVGRPGKLTLLRLSGGQHGKSTLHGLSGGQHGNLRLALPDCQSPENNSVLAHFTWFFFSKTNRVTSLYAKLLRKKNLGAKFMVQARFWINDPSRIGRFHQYWAKLRWNAAIWKLGGWICNKCIILWMLNKN